MKTNVKRISKYFILLAMLMFGVLATSRTVFAASSTNTSLVSQIRYLGADGNRYTTKYVYNKKGLLTKSGFYDDANGILFSKLEYSYNTAGLLKSISIYRQGVITEKVSYTYNANNQVTKCVDKSADGKKVKTSKYVWKNGHISKSSTTFKGDDYYPDGYKLIDTYSYNSKGVLTGMNNGSVKYTINKQGLVTRMEIGSYTTICKYVYSNGRPVKYRYYYYNPEPNGSSVTFYVSYKNCSVPKSSSSVIAEQQRGIIDFYSQTRSIYNY